MKQNVYEIIKHNIYKIMKQEISRKKKQKKYKLMFILLSIMAIILLCCIVYKYGGRQIHEVKNKEIVEVFSKITPKDSEQGESNLSKTSFETKEQENTKIKIDGYEVIGIIKIPKIQLEYPIITINKTDTNGDVTVNISPEEMKVPMKISIVKYWGQNVNDFGNLSIAGHNNYDGTMFGKTKKLEIGDNIYLTDLKKLTINYQIYNKFVTNPNDVNILKTDDKSVREVTLITCTNGNKERLILKARENK